MQENREIRQERKGERSELRNLKNPVGVLKRNFVFRKVALQLAVKKSK